MGLKTKAFITVIIAYYKNRQALSLILESLSNQSNTSFEVIIAEDDTPSDVSDIVTKYSFDIQHAYQAVDQGFRKNMMLNKSLKLAKGNYIVFLDGDCIVHPQFIAAYYRHMAPKTILFGRRVMLSEQMTKVLYDSQDIKQIHWFNLLKMRCKRWKYNIYLPWISQPRSHGIWGHNWGVWLSDLQAVNGFDEDYQEAGVGEDVDIEWRLIANGCNLVSIRFAAIQYHLHHRENYDEETIKRGKAKLAEKQNAGFIVCKNGLQKK
ncbi:MAG: glycosyltransferase [Saprospiraceae bacterium]